ncbi:malate dehydrogenase [Actinocatenispora comari]|uniref:Malate dehydrogenase n=1 Tax=Actinocatenispora comari TaxID=2807577 RepID=A0A8J4AK29_9ACTN|nr:malate dehydrogenase [Actinocatenispora comari]GIL31212.1 malate dehydrogenase [Actinocatenispora comari]
MAGKVSVIGAGAYGAMTAHRLAECDAFDTVVLTDVAEGRAEGLALDIGQCRPIVGFETHVVGRTTGRNGDGYDVLAGSDVVVLAAGVPRTPGMGRQELLETNAAVVRDAAAQIARYAAGAVLIVVTNPLDEMTALAQRVTGFPPARVIGQGGVLDSARFTTFVADELGVPVSSVHTLTLGSHGDAMVPVPSRSTVDGRPLAEVLEPDALDALTERTRTGGGEIVALLKTGSAYHAPSAAAAAMARAIAGDTGAVLPVCAWLAGEYGISEVYLGVPVELGATGVRRVVTAPLTESELAALTEAADTVRARQANLR